MSFHDYVNISKGQDVLKQKANLVINTSDITPVEAAKLIADSIFDLQRDIESDIYKPTILYAYISSKRDTDSNVEKQTKGAVAFDLSISKSYALAPHATVVLENWH